MAKKRNKNLPKENINYQKVNRDIMNYNRDSITSTMLPSYLKHELHK